MVKDEGGYNDVWFDRINIPGVPPPFDPWKVGAFSSRTVNILSGLSYNGLGSVYGGNTTNITYNVRTTKDMSLRSAERERRLYNR